MTAADGWELTPKLRMGQRLRDLRGSMDGKDLAPLVGISADLVSRIERGERWPQPVNVEAWARQTGHPDLVDELQLLREELRQDEARLRADAQRPKVAQELRSGFFRRSSRIRTLAVTNMPWYLQTAEYTRAEIGETPGVDDVIQLRRAGHDMVGKPGKYFEVLIAEAGLRYFPCNNEDMQRQLGDIQRLVGMPKVEIGVIPFGAVNAPLLGAFSVFDETTIAETPAGAIDFTAKHAQRYTDLMDRLWDSAVRGEAVRTYLNAAVDALTTS